MSEKLSFGKIEKAIWFLLFFVLFIGTYHVDLIETSNHSYIFLESIYTGNVHDFYNYVIERPLDLYYTNFANYNILTYVIFGIWQLPFFIVSKLFSVMIDDRIILFYTKILIVAAYCGCGYMVKRICEDLKLTKNTAYTAAIFFLFNPIVFFSPVAIGQHDVLCLLFLLWGLSYYIRGDMLKFTLLTGVSVVFKFFSLFAFIPLVLLKEKKILSVLKYFALSLWLYIPTTLLFLGKTESASHFTRLMFERLLTPTISTAFEPVSIVLLGFVLICVFCYFYCKKDNIEYLSVYIPMAVYVLLLYGIYWHPQWTILMMPFIVITTFMQKNKFIYWCIDIAMCFAFFMTIFVEFPIHFGASLISNGVFGIFVTGNIHTTGLWRSISELLLLRIPYFTNLVAVILSAALFANVIFKFPLKNTSVSDKITNVQLYDKFTYKQALYVIFAIGFVCSWFLPTLLELLNAIAII